MRPASRLGVWSLLLGVLIATCWRVASARNFGFQALGRLDEGEFHSMAFRTLDGDDQPFASFKGKVVLVTNVASECGYTATNYDQLKTLKSKFRDDLEVVLIPSNDFGGQEPGSEKEIREFINKAMGKEEVTVLEKSHVNGPETHPLIARLKQSTNTVDKDITWNFETKFFVSPDGKTVSRYSDAFEPIKLIETIKYYIRTRSNEL